MPIDTSKKVSSVTYNNQPLNIYCADTIKYLNKSLTSFKASDYGITSLAYRRFYQNYNLETLDLTGITSIPDYSAYYCTGLKNLTLDSNTTNIGQYAFYSCSNNNLTVDLTMNNGSVNYAAFYYSKIRSVKGTYSSIGSIAFYWPNSSGSVLEEVDIKVNGVIGSEAFSGYHRTVSSFNLDPTSVVTDLGQYAFYRFGSNRANASSNAFTFDFRNSTFTNVGYMAFSGDSSYKNKYMDIYFSNSLDTINNYVFQYTDHCNIYYKSVPSLSNTNVFYNATNFKNFFPYDLVQTAKASTNWSSSTNNIVSSIYGYAEQNTFSLGDTLPDTDADGYALSWYDDVAMTNQVTTVLDPTQIYYCSIGSKIKTTLNVSMYQVMLMITDENSNQYSNNDLVPIGATLTITAIVNSQYPYPYTFTLNGTNISSGDTYVVTDAVIDIVCVYWDNINPPIDPVFANNTPQQIKTAVDSGVHRTLWNIGDTKTITLTNGQNATIRYIDQVANRYEKTDGSGYTNAVFEFTTLLTKAQMNTSYSSIGNRGGWPATQICTVLMPQIYDLLPSDWKAVLSECKIPSATSGSDGTVIYADNYPFIPSGQEMCGDIYVNSWYKNEGCVQFDYYRINSANSYKIKQYNNVDTRYWLRSPCPESYYTNYGFTIIEETGVTTYGWSTDNLGVSVIFAI